MNENIKAFMQKVAADESLQAKMKSFTSEDEAYDYAKSIQEGFTKEEFVKTMNKISSIISDSGELSDEDLANVAGGKSNGTTAIIVETVASVTGGAISIAAAAGSI